MAILGEVATAPVTRPAGDLLVIGVLAGEPVPITGLPAPLAQRATRLGEGFSGRQGAWREGPGAGEVAAVALRGLGSGDELHVRRLGKWLREVAAAARSRDVATWSLLLPPHPAIDGDAAVVRVLRELALAPYRYLEHRQRDDDDDGGEPAPARLLVPDEAGDALTRQAAAVARATALARDLGNTPPNVATPEWLAERAEDLAALGVAVDVWAQEDLEIRGCGAILAVGCGSNNPPRLVRLEWKGADQAPVALVGKGVTFDTGGISIKPSAHLDEMKYDKCGACAVLAVIAAAAELRLPLHLVAWLPLAENMPSGTAYRPGDIVRCYNGKTVEVLNTDAEGRMILADALSLAAAERPRHLVELSTLTGACVIALGLTGAGLYSPDDELAEALLTSAESAGERLWRLPLWPEFREALEGHHGDLKNVAGRWGGASNAAAFLSQFVGEVSSWAHLDIAGPAYVGSDGEGPKGATGYGVALLLDWLRRLESV